MDADNPYRAPPEFGPALVVEPAGVALRATIDAFAALSDEASRYATSCADVQSGEYRLHVDVVDVGGVRDACVKLALLVDAAAAHAHALHELQVFTVADNGDRRRVAWHETRFRQPFTDPIALLYANVVYVPTDTVTAKADGAAELVVEVRPSVPPCPPVADTKHVDTTTPKNFEIVVSFVRLIRIFPYLMQCGERTFLVHRELLAAQSPVLRSLVDATGQTNRLEIPVTADFGDGTVATLVDYVYAPGKYTADYHNDPRGLGLDAFFAAWPLGRLADAYALEPLRHYAAERLRPLVNWPEHTCVELLAYAVKYKSIFLSFHLQVKVAECHTCCARRSSGSATRRPRCTRASSGRSWSPSSPTWPPRPCRRSPPAGRTRRSSCEPF